MRLLFALMAAATISTGALAQSDHDHAAHRAAGASAPAASASASAPSSAQMGSMMESMRRMHDKMKAAKTPEEREALTPDHSKTMREGMSMMGRMHDSKDADLAARFEVMKKRVDTMEMLMQMMMDHEGMTHAPLTK